MLNTTLAIAITIAVTIAIAFASPPRPAKTGGFSYTKAYGAG